MSLYDAYLENIETRKQQGLSPKPIDDSDLLAEIIAQIKQADNPHRADSLTYFIYNTLPGTTSAAGEKAAFLKEIILGQAPVDEIPQSFAFELLSHMKGGPSVHVLLDLALGDDAEIAAQAAAEFFTKLPEIDEEIKVVTYIAAEGDISTDLLSPGNQAHSRSDRELHGKCMISERAQKEIEALKIQHPEKRVMLIAEKGTMGVGSSRMSGVNNVALWTGTQASPYVPFVNIAPIVAGTNGISPIFLTTVGVTGGIGVDLKNWVKKIGDDGKPLMNNDSNAVLEQKYSVETGTVLTINSKTAKLCSEDGSEELVDIADSFTPQKLEFMKAGGSYAIVFGKKLQSFASETLGVELKSVFAPSKEITRDGKGLTAVEKIFNANALGVAADKPLHAGSDVRVKVNIVGSQDTTGLMTSQELEAMAATVLSPTVDGAYQSGCHTASVWDTKAQANTPRLMAFMNKFGLITARDPKGDYYRRR